MGILDFLKSCCEGKQKTAICVEGEEDNLLWGILFFAPIGAKVKSGKETIVVTQFVKKFVRWKVKNRSCLYV